MDSTLVSFSQKGLSECLTERFLALAYTKIKIGLVQLTMSRQVQCQEESGREEKKIEGYFHDVQKIAT